VRPFLSVFTAAVTWAFGTAPPCTARTSVRRVLYAFAISPRPLTMSVFPFAPADDEADSCASFDFRACRSPTS
jgi:hypothetical protein